MRDPRRPATSPTFALTLSLVHLCVWLAIPAVIVIAMVSSGGPNNLAGFVFLGVIFAFLGGVGLVGALVGFWLARRAIKALTRGDTAASSRDARASVRANLIFGALQLVTFAFSFLLLTKMHH